MDTQSTPREIYLGRDGARTGPYTMDDVRSLVGQGRFTADDWAWYPGAPQWIAIRDVPGFAPPSFPPPPPAFAAHYTAGPEHGVARYAGFWIRVGAVLIDGIILFIPLTILENLLLAERTGDPVTDLGVTLASLALSLGVHWAYRSAFHSSEWQATIGKRAVGIKVMDLQGRRITFAHATGRYFAEFLSGLTLGIGYVMAGISSRKQALHDKIAGTLVIYG
ncbi:MAG TPA: RDD family protein [Longimicrobium sp.]|nr:RDD family protein [Longimicrobium sp.]